MSCPPLHGILDAFQVPDLQGLLFPGPHETRDGVALLLPLLFTGPLDSGKAPRRTPRSAPCP